MAILENSMSFSDFILTFGPDTVLMAVTLTYICRLLAVSFRSGDSSRYDMSPNTSIYGTCIYDKRSLLNQNVATSRT